MNRHALSKTVNCLFLDLLVIVQIFWSFFFFFHIIYCKSIFSNFFCIFSDFLQFLVKFFIFDKWSSNLVPSWILYSMIIP